MEKKINKDDIIDELETLNREELLVIAKDLVMKKVEDNECVAFMNLIKYDKQNNHASKVGGICHQASVDNEYHGGYTE